MEFDFVNNLESCYSYVQNNPPLLYYSHIPTAGVALLIGFFVFFKDPKNLAAKILVSFSILFSLWSFLDLVTWFSYSSIYITVAWAIMNLIDPIIFGLSLYFAYVFVEKKDPKFVYKLIVSLFVFPVIFLTSTNLNITHFSYIDCESIQGSLIYYIHFLEIFFSLWIVYFLVRSYIKGQKENRNQILFFSVGIFLFLIAFSWGNITGNIIENWEITQYGLFGMPLFVGFLAYMIVKFKAFNIKLIGAQALVVTLFILIASQFAFIRSHTNMVLNGITLFLITIFGYMLIRGVKREILQREALALANQEIGERKDQLQKISDHLSVANAKLKELDTAKTEFVSIVAHQLQGPPTTVKGYSMLLADGSYGEMNTEQKDILQKIFNANEQQIEFVRDLLNVSRMESGRVNFVFEMCNLEDICKEVIDSIFIKAKDKGLYLEYVKSSVPLPEVSVDKAKMKEAITNLVDNAVKYTKRGGVSVMVRVCKGDMEKCLSQPHVRLTISDTGIGVPQSEMPHLFSKFSRGKDVKRLNAGGTGLGLYVVKMIAEGNKGSVWIESEGEGKGSRFIIELPIG